MISSALCASENYSGEYPQACTLCYTYFIACHIDVLFLRQETVLEFGAVFWTDAGTRLPKEKGDWLKLYDVIRSSDGLAIATKSLFSNWRMTHPGMYDYLPTRASFRNVSGQFQSGTVLVYNTQFMYENLIHWWYMCAMTPACISPIGHNISCKSKAHSPVPACHSHRYDQSSLNILAYNAFGYNSRRFSMRNRKVVNVRRSPSYVYMLRFGNCDTKGQR